MVQLFKSQVLGVSFILSLLASAEAVNLESLHVVRKIEALSSLAENANSLNTCFRVNENTLSFYLKNCSAVGPRDTAAQTWKLSDPVPTAIKDYIAPVEAQFGNDPALAEKFAKMKSYIPNDSIGRLIYMPFNNKEIVVGYLNTDVTKNETPYKTAYLADLCTGPWKTLCTYSARDKKFKWSFSYGVLGEDGYETTYKQLKIIDFLHAALYSRGNDDFQPLTYFTLKGPASNPDAKAYITKDWADALRPLDTSSRLSTDAKRSPIPRSEANYMTALHPVNVVIAEDEDGNRGTYLHFGAKIYYPRKAMESSCEDDTGIYALVDLKNINAPLPLNPEAISHMKLENVKKEGGINSSYDDFLDYEAYPPLENRKSEVILSDVSSTAKVPARANKWSLVIMSPKSWDEVGEVRPNSPVREFLFLDKKEDGSWNSELYAFNPNDWEANNSIHPERQLYHSPSSIRPVWNFREPNLLKSTHPVLRAPMKTLQLIPFEKASEEDRNISKRLRTLFSEERYSGIQMNTVHGDWGIEDKYHSLLASFTYDPSTSSTLAPEKIPSFVSIQRYQNEMTLHEIFPTDDLTLKIFSVASYRKSATILKEVRARIFEASDTQAQISAEMKYYEKVSAQVYAVKDFFANIQNLRINETRINTTLNIIWNEIPKADRKTTYTEMDYSVDPPVERQKDLPEELKKAIFDEKAISVAKRIETVEELFKAMNNTSLSLEERKAAAEKMYTFLREESEKLSSWTWLIERYNQEHPRG